MSTYLQSKILETMPDVIWYDIVKNLGGGRSMVEVADTLDYPLCWVEAVYNDWQHTAAATH